MRSPASFSCDEKNVLPIESTDLTWTLLSETFSKSNEKVDIIKLSTSQEKDAES